MHLRVYPFIASLIISSVLYGQEPWPRALEVFSPTDPDGFVIPAPAPTLADGQDLFEEEEKDLLEQADESHSPLMIWSLNDKGYLHQGRRKAQALTSQPIALPQRTRIYTGGTGALALGAAGRFYALLMAPSALHAAQGPKGWRWTLLEERSHLRLTCQGEAPRLRWQDYSEEMWRELHLIPENYSDVLIIRERDSLEIYQLQGRSRFYAPARRLLPGRGPGFLRELQDLQMGPRSDGRTRIELLPEQVLRLERKGQTFTVLLSGADPDIWGNRLLQSSPQIRREIAENEKPPTAGIRSLRLQILEERTQEIKGELSTLKILIAQGRNEEALHVLRRLASDDFKEEADDPRGIEAMLLYRLQQNEAAGALFKELGPSHPLAGLLDEERRLALLRAGNISNKDLPPPQFAFVGAPITVRERYQMGLAWQRLKENRFALDFLDLPYKGDDDLIVQRSAQEWRDHLLREKPWSYKLGLAYGRESNVLQNKGAQDLAEEPVDSARIDFEAGLERFFDRSEQHAVSLRLDLNSHYYQAAAVSDLHLIQVTASLPLTLHQVFGPQSSILFQPQFTRWQRGSQARLDALAYDFHASFPLGKGQFTQSLRQLQGLDPAPLAGGRMELATGERSVAADQSLRTIEVQSRWLASSARPWPYGLSISFRRLDFRSPLRDPSDRDIIGLAAELSHTWNLQWSNRLRAGFDHHSFLANREAKLAENAFEAELQTRFQTHLRWAHGLNLVWKQRPSVYMKEMQSSILWQIDTNYHW